ncbi:hypothetical protein CLV84_2414 [Neolewinella xylanilytica]|uniref:Mevalonate kinase n=1 Tax=Neolewinella xylanilytica TaxID=1514080 RepID=A0A2S6I2V1_9BACT|nr:GYDIA family GHMP kinase [Neolewinella xylanilytica]PPK85514.1 hypothetical protein CLV84_2414 [Neolewinella xylanilytica]
MSETVYYKHGKLLLIGEYFVLDGATALAVPTRLGQRFTVTRQPGAETTDLQWVMIDHTGSETGRLVIPRDARRQPQPPDEPVRDRLLQLFHAAEELRPGSTDVLSGSRVVCELEFPADWGLGSSSTLVSFLAEHLGVNPYALLERTFGGSGYDLACAEADAPLLYQRHGTEPKITEWDWSPDWLATTCFVHRNRKQNSRKALELYHSSDIDEEMLWEANQDARLFLQSAHLRAAARVATGYERLVADVLGLTPVREELFSDFDGEIKSLGAWGGDFVWALTEQPLEKTHAYFNERGYATVIPYNDLVL